MLVKLCMKKILLLSAYLLVASSAALAQSDAFPTKAIKVVVPFPPGGGTDTLMRIISPPLSEMWKQSIVLDNRPGASGAVGADIVIRSTPDGYTLLMATTALPDAFVNQLTPISLISASPYVLCKPIFKGEHGATINCACKRES